MNEAWNSFLQTVFQFVKSLFANVSKKMHRNAAVLTTGIAVVTVLTFTAGDFEGGGKNALVAFAETSQEMSEAETEPEETMESSDFQEEETETSEESEQESEEKRDTESAEEKETDETLMGNSGLEEETRTENKAEDSGNETEDMKDRTKASAGAAGISVAEEPEGAKEEEKKVYACSEKDYNVLLKIVQAEAGGCDTKGRILVANVILNRVESDEFPDTISGVVYEKSQFSPVSNGSINSCKVTQETIEAVERALAGEDYSEGALYFMNRKASSGRNVRWFDNHLDYLFQHGNHEFFK